MVRVLQFVDVINRYDFIDTIIQYAEPARFQVGLCLRNPVSNIAPPVFREGTPRWLLRGASRVSLLGTAWRLARLLRDWKADILHTHHFEQAMIGCIATRIYPKTRLVVGRHYSDSLYRLPSPLKRRALLGIERVVNLAAARIVVPSKYVLEILTARQKVDPAKVDRIPYAVVDERYAILRPETAEQVRRGMDLDGRFVVGCFGRLHEGKGLKYVVEAVAALRDAVPRLTLLLVGEGPERAPLERLIRDAGLEGRVRLLGWRKDALDVMAAVDAVVHPSLEEAFSSVMIESLRMGKPLIITDVGGANDLITDGLNGLLIPKSDAGAIASALTKLSGDERFRAIIGANAQRHIIEHLEVRRIIAQYEESYLAAIGC